MKKKLFSINNNFGAIGLTRFNTTPKPPINFKPHLGSETSICGKKAFINAKDARGIKACWTCGNFHKPTPTKGKQP